MQAELQHSETLTVSRNEIEEQLLAIQTLIQWSEDVQASGYSFETLAIEDAKLALVYFKDLLL